METRRYPICCTSEFCGISTCEGCRNEQILLEFKAWQQRTAAVRKDPIWSPRFWTATREED